VTSPEGGGPAAGRRRSSLLNWKALIGIAISAALLYITFRGMNLAEVWVQLRGVDVPTFAAATIVITGVFWIRAWRWRAILEPVADVPFHSRFAAVNIGFMGNNLLPARMGEFLRAYSLSRLSPVSVVATLSSLVVERLFDGIFVIGLLFLAMLAPDFPVMAGVHEIGVPGTDQTFTIAGLARSLGIVVVGMMIFMVALVLMPSRAVAFAETVVAVLPRGARRPIVSALEAFLRGAGVLRSPKLLLRVSAWSLVLWLWNALGFWIAFHAFGFTLPFAAAVFFASAIALAASIPSAPGFVGPWHLMATFVLARMWGVDLNAAGAFAVGFHLAGFVPVTLMGLYYAWRTGLSVREATESEETVEEVVEAVIPGQEKDRREQRERERRERIEHRERGERRERVERRERDDRDERGERGEHERGRDERTVDE
jgi:glycosyltransferase 2 family protein